MILDKRVWPLAASGASGPLDNLMADGSMSAYPGVLDSRTAIAAPLLISG